jgi:hypothetical protein
VLAEAPMAHICNPSYLEGLDQEDQSWGPAWVNSSQDAISKIIRAKWTEGVVQAVEHLLCKCEALSSNPSYPPPPITTKIECCGFDTRISW